VRGVWLGFERQILFAVGFGKVGPVGFLFSGHGQIREIEIWNLLGRQERYLVVPVVVFGVLV
jgi:hypothetical protein